MTLLEAYSALKDLGQPMLLTRDVAACLGITVSHANKTLARLEKAGRIKNIAAGKWVFPDRLDQLALPAFLTAPFPSYVSLQSALYFHGMVSQIPHIIYTVSLARTKVHKTPFGTVSIHHVQPEFFLGFVRKKPWVQIATPEKALVDMFYFFQTRSRVFRSLPELELPRGFSWRKVDAFAKKVKSSGRRALIQKNIASLRASLKS